MEDFSNGPLKHFEVLRKWKKKEGTPEGWKRIREEKSPDLQLQHLGSVPHRAIAPSKAHHGSSNTEST